MNQNQASSKSQMINRLISKNPKAFVVVDGCTLPIYKPCSNHQLSKDGIYAVIDMPGYVSILNVVQPFCDEAFSEKGFVTRRDEFHKSQMEVLKSFSKIVFTEDKCDETLIFHKLDDDTIQIDSFCNPIKCVGKNHARIVTKTIYRFTIIMSTNCWPLQSSAIKLEKNPENSEYTIEYIRMGESNEANKEKGSEFKILIDSEDENAKVYTREATTIQEMVKVVFERLLYISWAVSFWSLEPENGEKFVRVDVPAPIIPDGWYNR